MSPVHLEHSTKCSHFVLDIHNVFHASIANITLFQSSLRRTTDGLVSSAQCKGTRHLNVPFLLGHLFGLGTYLKWDMLTL
jgi:hypothetical protein